MGTREAIRPASVIAETPSISSGAYEGFIGVQVRTGSGHAVVFARNGALKPFVSTLDAMGSIFEPELRKPLAERDASASTAEHVRATLLEALPGGSVTTDLVARRP